MTRCFTGLLLTCLLLASDLQAQDAESGETPTGPDRTLGGPNGVPGELEQAEEIFQAFRRDNRKIYLKPWYDWKQRLKDDYGFNFGINASLLYAGASDVIGDEDDAFGGVYRLQGDWMLINRGTGNAGGIIFRVENRSKIGSGIPPASLRGEIGAAATDPGFAYSDNFGTDFSVLAWQQGFGKERPTVGVVAGLLDFSAYLDAFYFQTLARGFVNRSFILNPTVGTTGIGAVGAVARGMVSDHWSIGGGFYDANARSGDPGVSDFEWDELLKHVEVGYTPSLDRRGTDRIQLTYWHKDALPAKGATSGSGWLFSYSWKVADVYVPFVRVGISNGGAGVLAENAFAVGVAHQLARQDWVTLGVGWNDPSEETYGPGLDEELVFEGSYLWQITANTSLLGDVQLISDPAFNPDSSFAWVLGVRMRVAL